MVHNSDVLIRFLPALLHNAVEFVWFVVQTGVSPGLNIKAGERGSVGVGCCWFGYRGEALLEVVEFVLEGDTKVTLAI